MQYQTIEYVMHYVNRERYQAHHIVCVNANVSQLAQLTAIAEQGAKLYGFNAIRFVRPRN